MLGYKYGGDLYSIVKRYIDNKDFKNELFEPVFSSKKSYIRCMNEKISQDKRLREKDTFDMLDRNEIVDLIEICDSAISTYINNEVSKKAYNKVLSALCIKLISFTGIVYRKLRQVKISDDIEQFNKICIDEFKIYLPENYSKQLKAYIKLRNKILERENKQSDYLFITFEGKQLPKTTSTISEFLGMVTGRRDLTGIIKYAIRNMVLAGISDSIIASLTDAGSNIIKQCIDNGGDFDKKYWNAYIDSRLRNIDIFDLV